MKKEVLKKSAFKNSRNNKWYHTEFYLFTSCESYDKATDTFTYATYKEVKISQRFIDWTIRFDDNFEIVGVRYDVNNAYLPKSVQAKVIEEARTVFNERFTKDVSFTWIASVSDDSYYSSNEAHENGDSEKFWQMIIDKANKECTIKNVQWITVVHMIETDANDIYVIELMNEIDEQKEYLHIEVK